MLAGIGVGLYADEADAYAQVGRPGVTYEPDATLAEVYAQGFARYQRLYPALAELHHEIADGIQV